MVKPVYSFRNSGVLSFESIFTGALNNFAKAEREWRNSQNLTQKAMSLGKMKKAAEEISNIARNFEFKWIENAYSTAHSVGSKINEQNYESSKKLIEMIHEKLLEMYAEQRDDLRRGKYLEIAAKKAAHRVKKKVLRSVKHWEKRRKKKPLLSIKKVEQNVVDFVTAKKKMDKAKQLMKEAQELQKKSKSA